MRIGGNTHIGDERLETQHIGAGCCSAVMAHLERYQIEQHLCFRVGVTQQIGVGCQLLEGIGRFTEARLHDQHVCRAVRGIDGEHPVGALSANRAGEIPIRTIEIAARLRLTRLFDQPFSGFVDRDGARNVRYRRGTMVMFGCWCDSDQYRQGNGVQGRNSELKGAVAAIVRRPEIRRNVCWSAHAR